MKVVLFQTVDNLGRAGDTVDVKAGYFRNYLGPRGFAGLANKSNLRLIESQRNKIEQIVAEEKESADEIRNRIDGARLEFSLRAGDQGQLFGSVTAKDVLEKLNEEYKVDIDRRKLDMANIKTLGEHTVRVRVYPEVSAHITVAIERFLTEEEKLALEEAEKVKADREARMKSSAADTMATVEEEAKEIAAEEAGEAPAEEEVTPTEPPASAPAAEPGDEQI